VWLALGVVWTGCVPPAVAATAAPHEADETPPLASIEIWTDAREAVASLRRELAGARAAGDAARESEILGKLALAQMDLGEFDEAMRNASASLAAATKSGDRSREAAARGIVGDALYYSGDYAGALEEYRFAHDWYRASGKTLEAARQLKNIGVALHVLGRWEEAADALDSAARTFRDANQVSDASSALENLGRAYLLLGDTTRGFRALQEAVALAQETREARPLAHALLRFATVYLESGFYEKSIPPLRKAFGIFQRLDAPMEQSWALSLIAESLLRLGRFDEAIFAEKRALEISKGVLGSVGANNLARLGSFYLDRDAPLALSYLESALNQLERASYPVDWWIFAELGKAHGSLGDLDRAIDFYDRAIENLESARSRIVSERYRATYFRQHQSVYRELLELLWARHERDPGGADAERAFEVAERAKGRSLVDAIRETRERIGEPNDPGLARHEEEIRGEIASLERHLLDPGTQAASREEILEQVDRKEAGLALAVSELRRRDPRYASLLYPQPVSVDEARSLVDAKTALLAYFEAEDHLFVFLLTPDRLQFVRLETPPSIAASRVQNYLELMSDEVGALSRVVGRRLYLDLVAPFRSSLPESVSNLVIAPDGVLNFLPFETLLDGDRYLLERFNVAYVPSATVLRELRGEATENTSKGAADLLMFANPDSPGATIAGAAASAGAHTRALYESEGLSIPPIPYSGIEARFLQRIVNSGSRVYTGKEATEQRVKASPLDRFRVVHFATHGLVSQRWPARSALLLAAGADGVEDGLLTVPEICRLRFATDLVVLSACRTARGQVLAGDGVQGLARAFLHAGSRAVLASLWDVDDDRTAVLMRRFYEQLERGLSQSEALRAAKLSMIRDASTSAPRFWAGFILSGDATKPIPLAGPAWWRHSASWLIAAVGAAGAYLAYRAIRATA
jgi:CHAT domain-containing protein